MDRYKWRRRDSSPRVHRRRGCAREPAQGATSSTSVRHVRVLYIYIARTVLRILFTVFYKQHYIVLALCCPDAPNACLAFVLVDQFLLVLVVQQHVWCMEYTFIIDLFRDSDIDTIFYILVKLKKV